MDADFVTLICSVLKVPPAEVTPALSPKTCRNWDSLATVNLVAALEESYRRAFTLDELAEISSVGSIWKLVSSKESPANG